MRLSEDTIDKVVKWFNGLPENSKERICKNDSDLLLAEAYSDSRYDPISPRQFQRIRLERCGYKKKAANGEAYNKRLLAAANRADNKAAGKWYSDDGERKNVAEPEQERQLKVGDKARVAEGYPHRWFSPGEIVTICRYNKDGEDFFARKSGGDGWYIHSKHLEPLPEHVFKVGDRARVRDTFCGILVKAGDILTITGYEMSRSRPSRPVYSCDDGDGSVFKIFGEYLEPLTEPAQRTPSAKYSIIDIDGYTVSAEFKLKDNRIVAYPVLHTPDGKIIKPKIAEED